MLQGNELFRAQEDKGDQVRRERRQPELEFVRTVILYVRIYERELNGERQTGCCLHDTYDEAQNPNVLPSGWQVAAVRAVSIDL